MDPATSVAGAFVLGLATSVHCVGMCGPLACGVAALPGGEARRMVAAAGYHVGRLVSYGVIGTVCGAIGRQPLRWFFDSPAVLLPWVLVVALVLVALGIHKRLPRPKFVQRLLVKARMQAFRISATRGGLALGLATPLLPCAPLYFLVFAPLLTSGSAIHGAELALAFGIGTVPLLWGAQFSFHKLRGLLPPRLVPHLQRGLALLAAALIAWRMHDTLPFGKPATAHPAAAKELPSCCH
jgi:hypothetical protein